MKRGVGRAAQFPAGRKWFVVLDNHGQVIDLTEGRDRDDALQRARRVHLAVGRAMPFTRATAAMLARCRADFPGAVVLAQLRGHR